MTQKLCAKCSRSLRVYITCHNCDAPYHANCFFKIPNYLIDETGRATCCPSAISKRCFSQINKGTEESEEKEEQEAADEENVEIEKENPGMINKLLENTMEKERCIDESKSAPQSPPYKQQPTLTTLEPTSAGQIYNIYTVPQKLTPELTDYPKTPQTLAQELVVDDKLIHTEKNNVLFEPPSPSFSNSGSNLDDSSSSKDPEWIPEPVYELEKSRYKYKPYKILPVDKKNRKREQNKNAAIRYRMKRRAKIEKILSEEKSVLKENEELTSKIEDLQDNIHYLKGLIRNVLKVKGVIQ